MAFLNSADEFGQIPEGVWPYPPALAAANRIPFGLSNWFDIEPAQLVTMCNAAGHRVLRERPFDSRISKGAIYWFMPTTAPFSQTCFRDTLPVYYLRVVLATVTNPNPVFPNQTMLLHRHYHTFPIEDNSELLPWVRRKYRGFKVKVYERALKELDDGLDWWSEGAINKMDEVLFLWYADRGLFCIDDAQPQINKLKPRIVQSSHPRVTARVLKAVEKACKNLLNDWEESFQIGSFTVKFNFVTKMSQHDLERLLQHNLATYDTFVFVSGDDTAIFIQVNGTWYVLESDASHMDASQKKPAMKHVYLYLLALGIPPELVNLFKQQDSVPRWYSYDGTQYYVRPSDKYCKTTGSVTTSLGNSINIAIVAWRAFQLCLDPLQFLQYYRQAAVEFGFNVKAFYDSWTNRCPTFLKNLLVYPGYLVIEPGMLTRFNKTLTNPMPLFRTKDLKLALQKTAFSFASGIRFFHRDLLMDAWQRMLTRVGVPTNHVVKSDSYMINEMCGTALGEVRDLEHIYQERYGCSRQDVLDCIELIDSVQDVCSVLSHEVFTRIAIVAYG